MRGDSIRDFYAKAMAVTGLGVLAAVGALVDYWPTPLGVPHVPRAAVRFGTVGPLTLTTPANITLPVDRPVTPRVVRASLPVSSADAAATAAVIDAALDAAPPVATAAESAPETIAVERVSTLPAAQVSLSDLPPAPAPTVATDMLSDVPHMVAAVDDSDGVITGAFKKTGSSIATAGTKAGTGIATAARVVGGAFSGALKKVWF